MASWLGMGACVYFSSQCVDIIRFEPAQALHVLPELMCVSGLLYVEDSAFMESSIPPTLTVSAVWISKPWWEHSDEDLRLRTECSKVSHSSHVVQLCVSILV